MIATWVFASLFVGFLSFAAFSDAANLQIPNWLTASMAATGPLALWLLGAGAAAVPSAILTGAIVLGVSWAMFELGWLGGGDAKLAAAASLWLGAEATFVFVLATALFGAVLAAVLLVFARWDAARPLVGDSWRQRLEAESISVPYAMAMAPGGAVALFAVSLA